jgi:hypothetical protein
MTCRRRPSLPKTKRVTGSAYPSLLKNRVSIDREHFIIKRRQVKWDRRFTKHHLVYI